MNIFLVFLICGCLVLLIRMYELGKYKRILSQKNEEYVKEMALLRQQLSQRILMMDKMIKDLSFSNRELEKLNRLKSQFLAIVAHDLKQPLAAIQGYTSLLKDTQKNKEDVKMLATILRAADNMNELMNDLVDASVFSSGGIKVVKDLLNISTLLNELYVQYKIAAEAKKIKFIKNNCDNKIIVHADRLRLLQVISNLLSNAIKFTPAGGTVTLNCDSNEAVLRISVGDSGPGIPTSEHQNIFKRFHQLTNKQRPERKSGWGLGLPIAFDIIKGHGGKIWVESGSPAIGTMFFIEIPLDK